MPFDAAALNRSLLTECAALRGFVALLNSEQKALVDGDLELMASFNAPKAGALFEITNLVEARQTLLRRHDYPADRAGTERAVEDHAAHAAGLETSWRQVLQLTETAHALNATNGILIDTRLRGTQQALSVLFTAARIPSAYGADGTTVGYRPAGRIAVV